MENILEKLAGGQKNDLAAEIKSADISVIADKYLMRSTLQ